MHIKYLIEYNLSNIFQIWMLSKYKIIYMYNIVFDEKIYYNFLKFNLMQLVTKLMIDITFDILSYIWDIFSSFELEDEKLSAINLNILENSILSIIE